MAIYYFNVSGYEFAFDADILDDYPENLFKQIGTHKTPALIYKNINQDAQKKQYFLNRNPTFAKHIYGSIVHNFSICYLMNKIVPNYDTFELEQLADEFKYYKIPSLFSGMINVELEDVGESLIVRLFCGNKCMTWYDYGHNYIDKYIDRKDWSLSNGISNLHPLGKYFILKIKDLPTVTVYNDQSMNKPEYVKYFGLLKKLSEPKNKKSCHAEIDVYL